MEAYAYHGVPNAEQIVGHRYRIDLALEVEGSADISDDVSDTVDYGEAGRIALQCCTETQYRTVERLASYVAEQLLAGLPQVRGATVTVAKRLPPAAIIAESAGVTLHRSRS